MGHPRRRAGFAVLLFVLLLGQAGTADAALRSPHLTEACQHSNQEVPMVNEQHNDIPLYGSEEGRTAEIVRCHLHPNHIASRKAFENEGGCPYCLRTPEERADALQAERAAERRRGVSGHWIAG